MDDHRIASPFPFDSTEGTPFGDIGNGGKLVKFLPVVGGSGGAAGGSGGILDKWLRFGGL